MKREGKPVRRQPRIGKDFQIDVSAFREPPQPSPSVDGSASSRDIGKLDNKRAGLKREQDPPHGGVGLPLWSPWRVSAEEVDDYLMYVRRLFHDRAEQFCEQRALFFLQKCDFDVAAARELLAPCDPVEEEQPPALVAEEETYEGDDFCMVCSEGGVLIMCDSEGCKKVYHPACMKLEKVPSGQWICPRHQCNNKGCKSVPSPDFQCIQCPISYCKKHVPSALKRIQDRNSIDFLCEDCLDREMKLLKNAGSNGNGGSGRGKGGSKSNISPKMAMQKAFLRRVATLLKRQGKSVIQPMLGGKPVDLYKLYKEVVKNGGINNVMDDSRWRRIISALGLHSVLNASEILLFHYMQCLYTYERLHFSGFMPVQDKARVRKARELVLTVGSPPHPAATAPAPDGRSASSGNARKRPKPPGGASQKGKFHRPDDGNRSRR